MRYNKLLATVKVDMLLILSTWEETQEGVNELSKKVMLLGLDGATWRLLNPWISNNKLPTLRRIVDSGSTAVLKSTIPCLTIPALPSLLTGMNPGSHGILSFVKLDGTPVTLKGIKHPKLWNVLERHGFKSCIVGVRATFPPERLNGVMISGSAPSEKSDYTYPKDLKEKIKFEDDEHEKKMFDLRIKKRNKAYRRKLVDLALEQTQRRYTIFKKLNEEENYDFSMFWVEETDLIQHFLWEYPDSLLQFYTGLDDILRDILLTFFDRTLFIVSDHGFESRSTEFFFVNTWLRKEGYLRQKSVVPMRLLNLSLFLAYKVVGSLARGRQWRSEKLLALLARSRSLGHKSSMNQECIMKKIDIPGIDKEKSKAYLYTPFGIKVNSPSNYEAVREEIIDKLCRLQNQKGEKVVRDVWKREEIYVGKYLNELPDIVFLISEKYAPFPALPKNLFAPRASDRVFWWESGDHARARDGILLAYGPEIRKGQDLGSARIEDIFPTILHLMGCAIPDHVNGAILMSIFEENSEPANRKPRFEKFTKVYRETSELGRKDAEKIKQKLRELGYI